jgi:hypothetical protein
MVLYDCKRLSVTLREEHRLRVLRRIFEPKKDEVVGGWRKLLNEELFKFYFSLMIKSRRMNWTGRVTRIKETIILVEMLEGQTQLGRHSHRWEDNIKMDLR